MQRGLAILGTLGILGVLVWLGSRPEPLTVPPPETRSRTEPNPSDPPVPAPDADPARVGPEDPTLAQEEEKWLRQLLEGYRDPVRYRHFWFSASFPQSPIRGKGEDIERRILHLLRSLPHDDPLLPAVFRLVARIAAFKKDHPNFVQGVHDLAESGIRDQRVRGLSVAAEGFDLRPHVLHAAIRETDPVLRRLAVRAVGASSVEADWILTEMATALTDPDRGIRLAALRSLEQRGERTSELYPQVLSALESTDAEIRKGAVDALTRMPSRRERTGDALVRATGDEDPGVAHEAIWAVAMFDLGGRVPVERVLRDLDPGGQVLTTPAVMCLGQHGPAAVGALPHLLRTIRGGGNLTREAALHSLRRIQRAWEPAFETLEWCLGHAYIPTKKAAADLLSDFGPRAIPVLSKFRNDRDVGAHVKKILAGLKGTPEPK